MAAIFEGRPFECAIVYLKVAGEKEVLSLPFTEALAILTNVEFDYESSISESQAKNSAMFVIKGDTDKVKNKVYVVAKKELIERLQLDIYEDKQKITDIIIQPSDEMMTKAVQEFLGFV